MPDPLVALLQSEACQRLLAGLRRRAERGRPYTGTLRLRNITAAERQALSDLTGQPLRNEHAAIDLAALDQLIRQTERFNSLLELVETAAGGRIENQQVARQQQASRWRQVWEWAADHARSQPRCDWLVQLRETGWLRARSHGDHSTARRMLETAFYLLDQLPADGVPLAVFAAAHLGDAHALDLQRDLGRLVCRGIAALRNLPAPTQRSDLRRTWELAGIVPDELSATVLALNLPVAGDALTDRLLLAHAELGEPCRLTFRHLRLHTPTISPAGDSPLFVCENPSIMAAAADRLGRGCRPLVCVEGQPNLAAWKLLSLATAAGWTLAYHGDFDWGGIRIANQIHERFGFVPWRFDAAHFNQVAAKGRELVRPTAQARWDADLTSAMEAAGRIVEEEQVLAQLLEDLQR